jgi:hypothetical protein
MGFTPEFLRDLQFWFRRRSAMRPGAHVSNFNEQAIIARYIRELSITDRVAVDIGAGDGLRSSNTFPLFASGWSGLGIEADPTKAARLEKAYANFDGIRAIEAAAQPDTICDLLARNNINREFGLLSIDIDGNDYWVLDAILEKFRPQLIVSEYNEKIPPPLRFVVNYDREFALRHHFYGYSIAKLDDLMTKHNYVLLQVEYNNVFLAPRETGAVGKTIEEAYGEGYRDRRDRLDKFPDNRNMEPLLTMSPKDAVAFLNGFYAPYAGLYSLEAGQK